MKIDIYITNAITQYLLDNAVTAKTFADRLGISAATMVKWRRQGNGMTEARWKVLFGHIRKYLPEERIFVASNGEERYSSLNEAKGKNPYFEPKYIPQLVPVLKRGDMKDYNPMIQTVEQYACTKDVPRIEYRPHTSGLSGIFCFVMDEESSGIPKDARIFVSCDSKPRNNGVVFAVKRGGEIVIGTYSVFGSMFTVSGGNKRITGNIAEVSAILSMICPVVMYEVFTY